MRDPLLIILRLFLVSTTLTARSGESTTGRLILQNDSDNVISSVTVTSNYKKLTAVSDCQDGLSPKQQCTINYTYTAKLDVGNIHNSVNSQLNFLKISYVQNSQAVALNYYVVTMHVDTKRLLSIPMSLSGYNKIAGSKINNIYYDKNTQQIYLSTASGLSISDDGGKTWQTLTPFNSTLNADSNTKAIGDVQPMITYTKVY